jgi:hypothetical protein
LWLDVDESTTVSNLTLGLIIHDVYSGGGWEHYRFNHPTSAQADVDQDGDSICNRDEYLADTDPNQSNSYFHVTGLSYHPELCGNSKAPHDLHRSLSDLLVVLIDRMWIGLQGAGLLVPAHYRHSLLDLHQRFPQLKVESE